MSNLQTLTDEQINKLTQNKDLVEAIRKQNAEKKKEKQNNQSIEKLKKIIKQNSHLISIDMNKAGIRNSNKLTNYCKQMGYKIWANLIEINPEPEETIDPIKKLNQEKIDLTEKKESYCRIITSITNRIEEIDKELLKNEKNKA